MLLFLSRTIIDQLVSVSASPVIKPLEDTFKAEPLKKTICWKRLLLSYMIYNVYYTHLGRTFTRAPPHAAKKCKLASVPAAIV